MVIVLYGQEQYLWLPHKPWEELLLVDLVQIVATSNKAAMQCIKLRAYRQSKHKAIYIAVDNITFVRIVVLSKELLTMADLQISNQYLLLVQFRSCTYVGPMGLYTLLSLIIVWFHMYRWSLQGWCFETIGLFPLAVQKHLMSTISMLDKLNPLKQYYSCHI